MKLDDILIVIEDNWDEIDKDAAINNIFNRYPGDNQRKLLTSGLAIGRKLSGKFEKHIKKFTYKNVYEIAKKNNNIEIIELLEKYPNFSGGVIDWLRDYLTQQKS